MNIDRVILSTCFDPYLNLALEDYLFRSLDQGERVLYFWRNDPTVVIGRYQNPWLECRLDELDRDGVHLARRQSGGGTVYHDRGNLCLTWMGPRSGFDRVGNMRAIQSTLREAGFAVTINERNDLLINGRKISGSAYREAADRSFHHATLLFDADLERLGRYLKPRTTFARAKGIASVRSPVTRLAAFDPSYLMEDFIEAFAAREAPGRGIEQIAEETARGNPQIEELRSRWNGWDWLFGSSPDFTVAVGTGNQRLELEVRSGKYRLPDEEEPTNQEPREKPFSPQGLSKDLNDRAEICRARGETAAAVRFRTWAAEAAAL